MQAAVDAMASSLEADDAQRFIDSDLRFHIAVADATGNSLVRHTLDAIRDVLRDALLDIFRIPGSAERAVQEHRAILAAIRSGDGTESRIAARIHLDRVEADVHGNA
jgi:DNA-binding FadR family transcriptional regulator